MRGSVRSQRPQIAKQSAKHARLDLRRNRHIATDLRFHEAARDQKAIERRLRRQVGAEVVLMCTDQLRDGRQHALLMRGYPMLHREAALLEIQCSGNPRVAILLLDCKPYQCLETCLQRPSRAIGHDTLDVIRQPSLRVLDQLGKQRVFVGKVLI
jgi:hypothetical protein